MPDPEVITPAPAATPDPAVPDPNAAPAAPDPNAAPAAPDPNAAAPKGAPEVYDFKPSVEGQELDPEFIKVYSEVAKELNLPQDKAQEVYDKLSIKANERQAARIVSAQTEWLEASKADKEFGGDKLDETLGITTAVIDKYGTPGLKELLSVSGIGHHPEVIRCFYKLGKAILPDTYFGGHKDTKGGPKTFNQMADRLYGA
jgi:hypothetical protein